jgi:alpha-L-arabinofuranosidase
MNSAWGDVIDTNAFGTDEFLDFIQQIDSTPYVSINVGAARRRRQPSGWTVPPTESRGLQGRLSRHW